MSPSSTPNSRPHVRFCNGKCLKRSRVPRSGISAMRRRVGYKNHRIEMQCCHVLCICASRDGEAHKLERCWRTARQRTRPEGRVLSW